ncbi:MAG: putative zinc-binding peptidase [Gluconacetobacter diazotrophicus]|nr:putative zinc-binding peptidase [Gluconacetobacter diazotrophicus]
MKLFNCQNCGALLYFENTSCERCGLAVGFLPREGGMTALRPDGADDAVFSALGGGGASVRFCDNARHRACNWLVDTRAGTGTLCAACRHNRIIPPLDDPATVALWQRLEQAKRRLFYSLLHLRIPLPNRIDDPRNGLGFDFLSEHPGGPRVVTGHDHGLITIDVREADDAHREEMRHRMGETYRTLLGHFRHEIGHWIWNRLVRDRDRLDPFRSLFGDERQDYAAALRRHYANGPAPDWQLRSISPYATAHPWEDFAETWAHYLHIMDTLETANAFGLGVHPRNPGADGLEVLVAIDPYRAARMDEIVAQWVPLVFAVNSLNRSMGLGDLYPFVITPTVQRKLGFVHDLVHDREPAPPTAP